MLKSHDAPPGAGVDVLARTAASADSSRGRTASGFSDAALAATGVSDQQLAVTQASLPAMNGRPSLGATIGRYVVRSQLGAGGMGIVYRAYDPELGREIALKVIRPLGHGVDAAARARFMREAQAMARIGHPNVIAVHDVGTIGDQMFVAMELVDGADLGAWEAAGRRTWRAILGVYLQAARGLSAAHDAGLVHRDFKPANALVGTDGRVRVLDFGLVRTMDGEQRDTEDAPAIGSSEDTLTHAGAILGTPRFMAPEQHRGELADSRTDQYAFCVALFHALYRRFPHEGATYAELAAKVQEVDAVVPSSAVPGVIQRALRRGLARKRTDRFGSMHELIAALEPILVRSRRWPYAAFVAAVAVVAITANVAAQIDTPAEPTSAALFAQNQRVVIEDRKKLVAPDLSPDETTLAYATSAGLEFLDVATGKITPVDIPAPLTRVRWSPRGDVVVAASTYGPEIVKRDGQQRTIPQSGNECVVAWSPDAASLLWRCRFDAGYKLVDVASGTARPFVLGVPLDATAVDIDWGTAGIVMSLRDENSHRHAVYVAQPTGAPARLIATDETVTQVRWGASGEILLARKADAGMEIVAIDPARSSDQHRTLFADRSATLPLHPSFALSRDQQTVYVAKTHVRDDLAVMDTRTKEVSHLTADRAMKTALSVSNDSTVAVYASGSVDERKLYTMPTTGETGPRDLGLRPAAYTATAFSPDNSEVAFLTAAADRFELGIVTLATGASRRFPLPAVHPTYLAWSARGAHVSTADFTTLLTIDPRTGEESRWAPPAPAVLPVAIPTFDGRRFATQLADDKAWLALGVTDETRARAITAIGSHVPIAWSADEEWIYADVVGVAGDEKTSVTARHASGDGRSRLLGVLDAGAYSWVARDESRIFWIRSTTSDSLLRASTSPRPELPVAELVQRAAPRMLAFEPALANRELAGPPGAPPASWSVKGAKLPIISTECGRPGTCVELDGEGKGWMEQRFDAAGLRGKRIAVTVDAMVEDGAKFWIGVNVGFADGSQLIGGRRVLAAQSWKLQTVLADIEPHAQYVSISVQAGGTGRALMGGVAIEPSNALVTPP